MSSGGGKGGGGASSLSPSSSSPCGGAGFSLDLRFFAFGCRLAGGKKKEVKKETKLGMAYKKDDNFGEWYSEVRWVLIRFVLAEGCCRQIWCWACSRFGWCCCGWVWGCYGDGI